MVDTKGKLRNKMAGILVFGGMALYSLSIPSAAYLQFIRPVETPIISEYRGSNQELHHLRSGKRFSLEEALNSRYMGEYVQEAESLSARIDEIESSADFARINQYEEEKNENDSYWFYPLLSGILGMVAMLYGVHVESKINSRP